ncbi:MAG: hypothetical protein WB777_01995, partial [Mycobacterium sp.]
SSLAPVTKPGPSTLHADAARDRSDMRQSWHDAPPVAGVEIRSFEFVDRGGTMALCVVLAPTCCR